MIRSSVCRLRRWLAERDYHWLVRSQLRDVMRIASGCRTLLDVGCGPRSPLARLSWQYSLGIDGCADAIRQARDGGTHTELLCGDVFTTLERLRDSSFDAVAALDLIEHFQKHDGYRLLQSMERIARRVVIVSTPNGFLEQAAASNPLQEHRCGWDLEEMRRLGYCVSGLYGPKFLRGQGHELRFRPKILWGLAARLGHAAITRRQAAWAAGLLCSKRVAATGGEETRTARNTG